MQKYKYEYDNQGIYIEFTVDTDVFTEDMAKASLNFFDWDRPVDYVEGIEVDPWAIERIK